MAERTVATLEAVSYAGRVSSVVDGLRRLADEVAMAGKPYPGPSFDGTPRFANAANRVIHDLMWGFANLHADVIVDAAARADKAEAEDARSACKCSAP